MDTKYYITTQLKQFGILIKLIEIIIVIIITTVYYNNSNILKNNSSIASTHINKATSATLVGTGRIGSGAISSTCYTSYSINVLSDALEFLTCQFNNIFGEYVFSTENLFNNSEFTIFESNIQNMALYLIPLAIIIVTSIELLKYVEGKGDSIVSILYEFILNVILIIILPKIFSLLIDFTNSISNYFSSISFNKSTSLASSINSVFFEQNSSIPGIALDILWIFLFSAILFITVFFLFRFIFIYLSYSVILLLIPFINIKIVKNLLLSISEKTIQFILIQPIFILSVNFFLFIVKTSSLNVNSIIFTLALVLSLSFIPVYFTGLTVSRFSSISNSKIRGAVRGSIVRLDMIANDIIKSL